MLRSLLLILLLAIISAPLVAQNAVPLPKDSQTSEIETRSSALSSPDARLLTAPRIAADSMLQLLPLPSETPRFSPETRRPRDRWCGAAWGVGLGPTVLSLSLATIGIYRENPGEVLAAVLIGVVVGVPAGGLIGALIGC